MRYGIKLVFNNNKRLRILASAILDCLNASYSEKDIVSVFKEDNAKGYYGKGKYIVNEYTKKQTSEGT